MALIQRVSAIHGQAAPSLAPEWVEVGAAVVMRVRRPGEHWADQHVVARRDATHQSDCAAIPGDLDAPDLSAHFRDRHVAVSSSLQPYMVLVMDMRHGAWRGVSRGA